MPTTLSSQTTQTLSLTRRQSEVLQVIRNHIEKTGAPPTRAEIAKTLGFRSVNAAEDHLKALARKGAILLSPGTSRGIQLAKEHGVGLPIIKKPNLSVPLFSEVHFEGRMRLQNDFFRPTPHYLLQMQGISLLNAAIKEGDFLAIHCCDQAENGSLIVTRLHHKLIIGRYFREGSQIELKAEHPDYPSVALDMATEPLAIEGIVVGVIRPSV